MKKTLLIIIPVFLTILLIGQVSASWFNDFSYYKEHNYKNLYDFLNNNKDSDDNRNIDRDDNRNIDRDDNRRKVKSEYYQVDINTWLYQKDNTKILVNHDNDNKVVRNDDDNPRIRHEQEPVVYVQPSVQVIQKKVIYKKEIQQMMCDDYKCYIEYKNYYE